jgi:geranylgeranyl diphosphate synthase type I
MKYDNFIKLLKKEGEKVNNEIISFLGRRAETSKKLGDYHEDYYLNLREFILRGGKRLRPIALINAFRSVTEKFSDKIYLPSIAIELLHNATLLHDDIIDHDIVRRGGPTFHKKYSDLFYNKISDSEDFGIAMGILGGNSCFNLGVESILESSFSEDKKLRAISEYTEGFHQVIEGVFLESLMAIRRKSDEKEYLTMIKLKTSALFEKGILIGAILGGGVKDQLKALSKYALLAGQSFQIQDDILGTFGVEEETGKPADSDIKEGKLNLLTIKTLELVDQKEKNKIETIYGNSNATEDDVDYIRDFIKKKGILNYCSNLANKLSAEANQALDRADPPLNKEIVDFFKELSDFVRQRNK